MANPEYVLITFLYIGLVYVIRSVLVHWSLKSPDQYCVARFEKVKSCFYQMFCN